MSDFDYTTLETTTLQDRRRRSEPFFTPLDFAAFVVIVLMIWGPLAAGTLRI